MLNPTQWPELLLQGTSPAAQRLRLQVERVAPHFRTAMLVGEAGCLKIEVARALVARSPLRDAAFQVVEAAQFRAEVLDSDLPATVFLAGVGDLAPEQQAVVAQRLQLRGRRTEVRLICSSDVAPRGLLAAGRLHPELHGCVGAVEIRVAPLRERLEDLGALLEGLPCAPELLEPLLGYLWPGNFRELYEVLLHARDRAGAGPMLPRHLPPLPVAAPAGQDDVRLESVLRRHVVSVLEGCAGNKLRAAEMLGISRSTLYRMLDAH